MKQDKDPKEIPFAEAEEVLRQEYAWIKRSCFFLMRDQGQGEAEDFLQDALIEIARSLRHFRGDSQLRTWMFIILRRLAVKRRRNTWLYRSRFLFGNASREIGDESEESVGGVSYLLPRDPVAEELLFHEERKRELFAAIKKLPKKQGESIYLFYLEELSVKEVAQILECSESAVKTHLARGREALRRVLEAGKVDEEK